MRPLMDPNEALMNALGALTNHRILLDRKDEPEDEDDTLELEALRDLADAFEALNDWLSNGRYLPSAWAKAERRA